MFKVRIKAGQPTSTNLNSARFNMTQTSLAKHRIERHLVVSSFVRDVLRALRVRTVRDLCELKITAVQELRGMGVKRIAEVRGLIGAAKKLNKFGKTTEKPEHKTAAKVHTGRRTHLVFVPHILRTAFEQLGIDSVESLLSVDCDALALHPNMGSKKTATAIGIQVLYKRLASPPKDAAALRVSDLVPEVLLPDSCVGRLSMEDFLSGDDGGTLGGKALHEVSSLRMLLLTTLRPACDPLNHKALEWREIGLRLPSRVETVAKECNLNTVAELEELAIFGSVIRSTSKDLTHRSRKGKLGDKSLGLLREELRRLQTLGVPGYRKHIVCILEDIDCPNTPWYDVPLRVSKRIQEFLIAFDVVTIADVHRVVLRQQAFCRVRRVWVDFSEIKNFHTGSVGELRDELAQLALLGKERYRLGGALRPKTLKELAAAALKMLDRRELQIVKARCIGATYAVTARRLKLTGERVRQIALTALKRLEFFRPIATELMKQFIDSLPRDVKSDDPEIRRQLCLDERWHFSLLLDLSGYSPERLTSDPRR